MPRESKPRAGSLQFWPRKRARKVLPSVNWKAISSTNPGIQGFIAYKVGMASVLVKDLTPNSMTKDKRIFLPVTILEAPPIKIFSVRFYKQGRLAGEVVVAEDKELKRKLKLPGKINVKDINEARDYDDLKIIAYSKVDKTGIKKTPDLAEIALGASLEDKLKFIKENIGKEISADEMLRNEKIIDVRGLTKGKGIQGPVKRFGIKLKQHKSEKGRRRPGNLGPWHPAFVTFRAPQAGQLGMFSRIKYNNKIVKIGKITEQDINPKNGWKNFGMIRAEYIILQGSVPGVEKRALLLTKSLIPSKKQLKKNYEFVRLA